MVLIEIKWSLRQNMWKVATGIFNTIQLTNVITCPGYHSYDSCPNKPEGELNYNPNKKTGNKYINDISIGDYAIIFASGETSALLVRITSKAYRKVIPEITIYKKWGHKNFYDGEEIEVCVTGENTRAFTHTEIMVAYVRDVEVIKVLNYDEYPDIINKYKKIQTSIIRNRSDLRFINI
jgi:hypothetical protein